MPSAEVLQPHPQAPNVQTLPVSFVEMKLDELYDGIWSTENEQSQIIVNEIAVSLELHVYHPIKNVWIKRVGVGAFPILQKSGSAITDIDSKLKAAAQMNYGAAKAMALKNAAASLGKAFGRDLNRKNFAELVPAEMQLAIQEKANKQVYAAISAAPDLKVLTALTEEHSDVPGLMERVVARRKELEPQKLTA